MADKQQVENLGRSLEIHNRTRFDLPFLWSFAKHFNGMTLVICIPVNDENLAKLGPNPQYVDMYYVAVGVQRLKNKREAKKFWNKLKKVITWDKHQTNRSTLKFGEQELVVSKVPCQHGRTLYNFEIKTTNFSMTMTIYELKELMNAVNEYFGLDVQYFTNF